MDAGLEKLPGHLIVDSRGHGNADDINLAQQMAIIGEPCGIVRFGKFLNLSGVDIDDGHKFHLR
jgi:hypothetical protein